MLGMKQYFFSYFCFVSVLLSEKSYFYWKYFTKDLEHKHCFKFYDSSPGIYLQRWCSDFHYENK